MRAIWHRARGHQIVNYPTLTLIPATWHHCSCGQDWIA